MLVSSSSLSLDDGLGDCLFVDERRRGFYWLFACIISINAFFSYAS